MRPDRFGALASALAALFGLAVMVQGSPTATLTGRVTDSFGGVLPGAKLEATHVETNTTYLGQANKAGLYRISNLPPGNYRLVVRMFGFRTIVRPNVELHVQDVIALNFSMQIGSVIESVTEEEGVPLIQAETAMQGSIIDQLVITELPSLTRNPYDFVSLSAGAVPASVTRGIGMAVNGQRAESGSFLLDGSDNNEAYNSGPGQIVPLDAVQEYRLQTSNFTAEFGRNVGFIANVVTKTGTNEFRGVAYDFLRNSKLAANTFENNARALSRPVFNRHQFGGAFGGPVRRDNAFFFGAFESILVRSSAPTIYYVPTPQLLAIGSPGTREIFRRFPLPSNLSTTDVLTRTLCPFGISCDFQTGMDSVTLPAYAASSRTGPLDAGAGVPQNTVLWTARWDYNLSARTVLTGRYAFQNANQFATVNQPYSPNLDQSTLTRNQNVTFNVTRFWSGNLVTESRIVYNRLLHESPQVPSTRFPSFTVVGEASGSVTGGLSLPSGVNGTGGPQNAYQFYQTGSWIKGKHHLKFGGQYIHLRENLIPAEAGAARSNQGQFSDTQAFVDGILSSYQIALDPKGHVPGEVVDPPFGPSATRRHYRYNDFGFFSQDFWKLTSRLTLSPGLRYEYFGGVHPAGYERPLLVNFYYGGGSNIFERIASGRLLRTIDAPGKYRNHLHLPDRNNFGPRMGLAYDITGKGRTVFRSGAGVFFERLYGFGYTNSNPPAYSVARLSNVPVTPALFDDPYALFSDSPIPLPPSVIVHLDQDLRTGHTAAWNASLEHQVNNRAVLSASYIGSSGNRLYQANAINRAGSGQFVGRPGERLVNSLSSIFTGTNLAHSSYHGVQFRVDSRNIRRVGVQFGANYTWSHSIDNVSSMVGDDGVSGGFGNFVNAFDPSLDKGSSDHDIRHRLVTHFIWRVPVISRSAGYMRHLIEGWEISGILSFQTGQPFNLRDNLVPGRDTTDNTRPRATGALPQVLWGEAIVADALTPNAFLILPLNPIRTPKGSCIPNATPFGCQLSLNGPFEGTIGRNGYRRPGTHFQNVALIKNFNLSRSAGRESMTLQFRAEFYNLLNHSNLYVKVGTGNLASAPFNPATGLATPGVLASFGTPNRFPQEARQIVMALKLIF